MWWCFHFQVKTEVDHFRAIILSDLPWLVWPDRTMAAPLSWVGGSDGCPRGFPPPPGVLLSVPLSLRLPSGLCSDPAPDFWRHLSPEVFVYFLVMAGLRGPEVTVSADFATSQYIPYIFFLFFQIIFWKKVKRYLYMESSNKWNVISNILDSTWYRLYFLPEFARFSKYLSSTNVFE